MAKGSHTTLRPTSPPPLSKRLAARRAAVERSMGEDAVREAFFSRGQRTAVKQGVALEDVIEHLRASGLPAESWHAKWVDDLILVAACARGDQPAWSDLMLAHGWRLREAATEALGHAESPVAVARFFAAIRRTPRESLATFDGRTSLSHWLGARFATMIGERLPRLDKPRLDTEAASRTLLLRSDGRCADDSLAT